MIFLITSQIFYIQDKTSKLDSIFIPQDLSLNQNWESQALNFWQEITSDRLGSRTKL
ncbi:MAG: hypothetical protein ACFBSE_05005 [Prochloraceae cyanobacterium]